MNFNKVCVIGLGYIGLPTAVILASRGVQVVGVDINPEVIATINSGNVHIVEPDLDILVKAAVTAGKFVAKTQAEEAEAFIIAVPTPLDKNRKPDISYIKHAAETIAPHLKKGGLVVLESTSPVGTTRQLAEWLQDFRPDLKFPINNNQEIDVRVAYCPERVLPGKIVREIVENDRIIGALTDHGMEMAEQLYKTFVTGNCHTTNAQTAEMVKLTENSYRDTCIAFANELSMICDELDIDVWNLIRLANLHPRVDILDPGPGVGGHCIAVDPWFVISSSPDTAKLIQMARDVNDKKTEHVTEQIVNKVSKYSDPTIACLGLTYKADTDDMRESPSIKIINMLVSRGLSNVLVVDPYVDEMPAELSGHKQVKISSLQVAVEKSDIIVILVDHQDFVQWLEENPIPQDKEVLDTRNLLQ